MLVVQRRTVDFDLISTNTASACGVSSGGVCALACGNAGGGVHGGQEKEDIGRTMTPGPGMPVRKPFLGSSSQAAMVFRVAWL